MNIIKINKEYSNGVELHGYYYGKSPEIAYFDKRPAVVVFPGGGYCFCSDREAEPIAAYFLGAGFNVFVFTYSLHEKAAFPRPLIEASVAIRDIREHAEEWNTDKDKIAVSGFSAGGHLAALLGTLWNMPEIAEKSGCPNGENKPNALILGYPVINTRSWMSDHVDRLTAGRDRAEAVKLLDTENNVGKHTPPTFLFHTYADNVVSVEDSLCFANALAANDVPFEMHVFTAGYHGLATADGRTGMFDPSASKWMQLASDWLWRLFGRSDVAQFCLDFQRKHPNEGDKI